MNDTDIYDDKYRVDYKDGPCHKTEPVSRIEHKPQIIIGGEDP